MNIPKEFWIPVPIKPISGLADLRKIVIEHNEGQDDWAGVLWQRLS